MLDSLLARTGTVLFSEILICSLASLGLGLVIALVYMFRNTYTKSYILTLVLLPALVQAVIMLVNGNLGVGIAVAGAFNLVRFRSAPGSSREIACVFFAMAVGLATGMGFLLYAVLFTVVISAAILLLALLRFGEQDHKVRKLRVMIPEDQDYNTLFDDLFQKYTVSNSLDRVRTTNLGGLYELQYLIRFRNIGEEKALLDQIRQRNGNLSVVCGRPSMERDEL